jgi:NitT/TauT family transport system substrate-binding protein
MSMSRIGRTLALAAVATLAAVAAATAAEKVSIAINRLSAGAPFYIAKEKGFFAEQELDVALSHLASAQTIGLAVASGDVDFGMTTVSAGIYAMAAKGALKMIAGGYEERPRFHGLALVANKAAYERGLKSPADIKGRRVAITAAGSGSHNQLARLAGKYAFSHDDMHLVELQTLANEVSAVKSGQVDAAPLPAALARELEDSGAGRIIAWLGDEMPTQVGGVFATPETIDKRRGLTTRFVHAYVKALQYYTQAFLRRDDAGKAIRGETYDEAIRIISQHTGESPAALAATLPYFDPEGRIAADDLAEQIEVYKRLKLLDPTVEVQAVIDRSFVPAKMR